jgi:hypothetical protein
MSADTIETALRDILLSDAAIAGRVSTRIHPIARPQGGALPAIVYQRLTTEREHSTDGATLLASTTLQVSAWADRYTEAFVLADYVRQALDGYSATVGTVTIQVIHVEDEGDIPSLVPGNEELNLYGRRIVIEAHYNEA